MRGVAVGERPHVLIVDDDPALREALTAALAGVYVVHATATGDGAYVLLRLHPVAAIVLDAILGEEHGLDLIQKLRALSPVPILILTGHGSEELAALARRALTESLDREHTTESLAREIGLSERHLRRQFSEVYGKTPRRYLNETHDRAADAAHHSRPQSA